MSALALEILLACASVFCIGVAVGIAVGSVGRMSEARVASGRIAKDPARPGDVYYDRNDDRKRLRVVHVSGDLDRDFVFFHDHTYCKQRDIQGFEKI